MYLLGTDPPTDMFSDKWTKLENPEETFRKTRSDKSPEHRTEPGTLYTIVTSSVY